MVVGGPAGDAAARLIVVAGVMGLACGVDETRWSFGVLHMHVSHAQESYLVLPQLILQRRNAYRWVLDPVERGGQASHCV